MQKALVKLQPRFFHARHLQAQLTVTSLSMTPSCTSRVCTMIHVQCIYGTAYQAKSYALNKDTCDANNKPENAL